MLYRACINFLLQLFIVPAKTQQWSASLCHSLVPHTYVKLLLRFADNVFTYASKQLCTYFIKASCVACHLQSIII